MALPRGGLTGTAFALTLAWLPYGLRPSSGLLAPVVQTVIFVGLAVLTARSRRLKILLVRSVQRWIINPVVRALFAIGLNPLGLVILETRGRTSGQPRRTPVGNGRTGDSLWIIAEHGAAANYVRNIARHPEVRVHLRQGLRYHWVSGLATALPDDDPLTRQRQIVRWHPLRALNAMNVRLLGADLLTIHVDLRQPAPVSDGPAIPAAVAPDLPRRPTVPATAVG